MAVGKAFGRHLQGNVIGYLALFIAMSGVAYATTLPANSVGTKQLKKNAVTKAKLKKNAVTGAKVRNNSLTGADIRESTLARVPRAASSDFAATAATANTAHAATTASAATIANDSHSLGGLGAAAYQADCGPGEAVVSIGRNGPPSCAASTSITLGGGATPPTLDGSPAMLNLASTTVDLDRPGSILALGTVTTDRRPQCPPAGCTIHLGLYLDGEPIPGSGQALSAGGDELVGPYAPVQGLAADVAAGPHTVELKLVSPGTGFGNPTSGSAAVSAISLAG